MASTSHGVRKTKATIRNGSLEPQRFLSVLGTKTADPSKRRNLSLKLPQQSSFRVATNKIGSQRSF